MECRDFEMKLEESIIRPRKCLKELFNYLTDNGKEVVLTTDMHLPLEFIDHLLTINGFRGYRKIYLSRNGRSKSNGKLFDELISDHPDIDPSSIVHLGDSRQSDFDIPSEKGIHAIHIPNPRDTFLNTALGQSIVPYSDGDRVVFGYLANTLCDDPFHDYKEYSDGRMSNLGILLGMHFMAFTNWMLKDAKYQNVDNIVLIMSDGHLESMVLDVFSKHVPIPDYCKVHLSRILRGQRIALNEGISGDPLELKYYVKPFFFKDPDDPRLKSILKKQENVRLPTSDILYLNQQLDRDGLSRSADVFDDYVRSFLVGKRSALFDSSFNATALKFVRKYLPDVSGSVVCEYELSGSANGPDVRNYIENKNLHRDKSCIDLDLCLKTSDPKVYRIDKEPDGYIEEKPGLERLNMCAEFLQKTIVSVCEDFLNITHLIFDVLDFSNYLIWHPLILMWESCSFCDKKVIDSYARGILPEEDIPSAVHMYEENYRNGDSRSAIYLATIYQQGKGIEKDPQAALQWARTAYNGGVRFARFKLFDLLLDQNKIEEHELMYSLATEPELDEFRLGRLYQRGIHVPKDPLIAAYHFYKATESGNINYVHVLFDQLWAVNMPEYDRFMISILERGCRCNNTESLLRKAKYLSVKSRVKHRYYESFCLIKRACDLNSGNVDRVLRSILGVPSLQPNVLNDLISRFHRMSVDEWLGSVSDCCIPPIIFALAESRGISQNPDLVSKLQILLSDGLVEAGNYLNGAADENTNDRASVLKLLRQYDESCSSGSFSDQSECLDELCAFVDENPQVNRRVGHAYRFGHGRQTNLEIAAEWLRSALTVVDARMELFDVLWAINTPEADAEMIRLAYDNQAVPAFAQRLGRAYRDGKGVDVNLSVSAGWMEKACSMKPYWVEEYMDLLWRIGSEESLHRMFGLASEYADKGNASAMGRLGLAYYYGKGTKQNRKKGLEWLKLASDGGVRWATSELNKAGV